MRTLILLTAVLISSAAARASLIVGDVPGPNPISFGDGTSNCSSGPSTEIDSGFSISTNGAACFSFTGWSFADNGQWINIPALADDSATTTITIDLGGSWSRVWGFMNYAWSCNGPLSPCSYFGNDPTITALDSNMNIVETYDLSGRLDVGDSSEFDFIAGDTVGFQEGSPDIAYLQFGGDYIAMTDISLEGAVPEPRTMGLGALGLISLGLAVRGIRKKGL